MGCGWIRAVLLGVAGVLAWCQTPPLAYRFKVYGTEQGLGSQTINDVIQDPAGYLWVGTDFGL